MAPDQTPVEGWSKKGIRAETVGETIPMFCQAVRSKMSSGRKGEGNFKLADLSTSGIEVATLWRVSPVSRSGMQCYFAAKTRKY
jgi:hypothetical protein